MGYLRFIRFPGVFTALADILAGFFILRFAGLSQERLGFLPQMLMASACFYLAGMAWNDLFDAEEDAKLRPERPLPSGEVSATGGYLTGIALITAGIMLAMTGGRFSFFTAAALTLCIFAYDSLLKKIPIVGPLCMGACRGLNMLLGMSAHPALGLSEAGPEVWLPPLILTLYTAAVTVAASWEDNGVREEVPTMPEEPPTEIASDVLRSAPPSDPQEGIFQNTLRRKHELDIVLQQNQLKIHDNAPTAPAYTPPLAGIRYSLAAVAAAPVLLYFLLPQWPAVIFSLLWLALFARPGVKAWRLGETANLRPAVGTALSGICLLDAGLLAGFSGGFLHNPEEAGACVLTALMALPVFILRKYIV